MKERFKPGKRNTVLLMKNSRENPKRKEMTVLISKSLLRPKESNKTKRKSNKRNPKLPKRKKAKVKRMTTRKKRKRIRNQLKRRKNDYRTALFFNLSLNLQFITVKKI